jgi:hypothetical protein
VSLELTNWAGNLTYGAEAVHYPTSTADVQELVARLSRGNHSRQAGCGGVQGFPVMASRSAVRTSSPCLRTVEM